MAGSRCAHGCRRRRKKNSGSPFLQIKLPDFCKQVSAELRECVGAGISDKGFPAAVKKLQARRFSERKNPESCSQVAESKQQTGTSQDEKMQDQPERKPDKNGKDSAVRTEQPAGADEDRQKCGGKGCSKQTEAESGCNKGKCLSKKGFQRHGSILLFVFRFSRLTERSAVCDSRI